MEVDSTLGFIEIGVLASGILFGIFTMQVYIYHKNFAKDPGWIKYGLVDGMCVSHYGDPTVFLLYPMPFVAVTLFDALIATLATQGYFTYRIAKLTGPPYVVPIICCILMVCHSVNDIGMTVECAVTATKNLELYLHQFKWMVITSVVIRVATDIVISTALVYYLQKSRSNALHSSMVIVDKLMQWAIETGIVTRSYLEIDYYNKKSMVNILLMICLLINVDNYLWVAFYVILPKVFSNAMLANLNSRMKFRNMQTIVVGEMVAAPSSGTTTQGTSELQTSLPKVASIHGESMMEEGQY
ncbi:hypothetical protein C8J55DRAFT_494292 [Lentinula edodes]|uniref:DUF6534 domain-containing protein n=1 Tax=Lentinula lateritia TaxID=40482 RepID=A0A9W9DCG4_9AGAR|nr:hypothetical protein C8J55DRAFT_494292 [Lentinula edodes]